MTVQFKRLLKKTFNNFREYVFIITFIYLKMQQMLPLPNYPNPKAFTLA